MKRFAFVALCLLVAFGTSPVLAANDLPRTGSRVPAIILPDVAGHPRCLTEFKNRPLVLFFFCGCPPCHACARLWADVQQAGEISRGRSATGPQTVAVFLGDAEAARRFASKTGMDPAQTLLLMDPSDRTGQRFGVIQCPRVFVLDAGGRLTYTNSENNPGTNSPRLSAAALVSRTLTAWRHLPTAPASKVSAARIVP